MAGTRGIERKAGTDDALYNLVSVLYHELQQVETCERYLGDAHRAGDEELVLFFEESQRSGRALSERAKALIRERLGQSAAAAHRHDDALVEEGSKESFPASDAPAY